MSVRVLRDTIFASLALLIASAPSASAQALKESMDVVVNGPPGALLLMDGQAKGTLPLPVNLSVPAGQHRFRLQLGKQSVESDLLNFQGSGQAELNLTLSARTLVATLRITDGLLWLTSHETLRPLIAESIAQSASKHHAVLISGEREKQYLRNQTEILKCFEECGSSAPLLPEGQVSYALLVQIENGTPDASPSCLVRASLLDIRTREVSARTEEPATPCRIAELSAVSARLTSTLLQDTLTRPRGTISVTSNPPGARVRIDGRWIGMTPLQQEVFSGTRVIEVECEKYVTQQQKVAIESGDTATVQAALVRLPSAPLPRPLWRLVSGGILIGGGLLTMGFGGAALGIHGTCQDSSKDAATCSPYYNTQGVGIGLLSAGAILTAGGALMIAIPSR